MSLFRGLAHRLGMHDAYRIGKKGNGSFDDVIRGWSILRWHCVDTNILCTINAANQDHPAEVYRFFRDELQAPYIQLIPIVERATEHTIAFANRGWGGTRGSDRPLYRQEGSLVTGRTVSAEAFGRFLMTVFDEWVRRDVGKVFFTTFDVAQGSWAFFQHIDPAMKRMAALVREGRYADEILAP